MVNRIDTDTLSRRKLLALVGGGTVAGLTLGSHAWFRGALASSEPPGPTIPAPSVPEPASSVSVAAKAAELDWDLDKIFGFVAGEVAYEPYPGALRGATGTLWAAAGNSVDQALLLGALLAEAKVPYRLVSGKLDERRAEKVIAGSSMDLAAARTHGANVSLTPTAAQEWTREGLWSRHPDVETLVAAAGEHISTSASVVAGALDDAGIELPRVDLALPETEQSAHFWVQYADGPNWVDLDPTIPSTAAGTAIAADPTLVDEIPDGDYHTVTIRLVADVVTGGVPTRTELLSRRIRSADVVGEPVLLVHAPADWLGVAVAISGEQQYVPMVVVGDDILHGTPLTLRSHGGVSDAFGEQAGPEGQALAEWLEVDIEVPGADPRHVSRVVFDRVPAEHRSSGTIDVAALPDIELTELDELGPVFLPFAGPRLISIAGQPVPAAVFAPDVEHLEPVPLVKAAAQAFYATRQACQLRYLDELGHRFFPDEPTVLTLSLVPGRRPDGAVEELAVGLDLLHSHHGAIALTGATAISRVNAGVLTGVVDHAAERLAVESPFSLQDAPPLHGATAGRIFELAAEQDIAIAVARTAADIDALEAPAAAVAYMREAIDAGRVLVVPTQPVDVGGVRRIAWWECDLTTGRVFDRLDTGGGAGEYTVPLESMWKATTCFRALAGFIVGVARGVTGFLDGYSGVTPALLVVQLIGGAACGASL